MVGSTANTSSHDTGLHVWLLSCDRLPPDCSAVAVLQSEPLFSTNYISSVHVEKFAYVNLRSMYCILMSRSKAAEA
jgi:hypothetical protein